MERIGAAAGPDPAWIPLLRTLLPAALLRAERTDTVEATLTAQEMGRLAPPQVDRALADALFHSAKTAALEGRRDEAMGTVERLFAADPESPVRVLADPVFGPFRREIAAVLHRATVTARMDAERELDRVTDTRRPPEDAAVVAYARKQFETGQYAGYWHAVRVLGHPGAVTEAAARRQELPGIAARQRHSHQVVHGLAFQMARRGARQFERIWTRLPLLAVLLTWAALGIAAGLARAILVTLAPAMVASIPLAYGYAVWALGLLAIVVFAFLRSVWRL